MLKKEQKLVRKYAKMMNIDSKIVMRLYEHGDEMQRQIDYVAMEATIFLQKAKKDGKISVDDKGQLTKDSQYQVNALIQEYLKGKKNIPAFFKNPLPMIIKQKPIEEQSKHEGVIE